MIVRFNNYCPCSKEIDTGQRDVQKYSHLTTFKLSFDVR
jgi:hypothetical protein